MLRLSAKGDSPRTSANRRTHNAYMATQQVCLLGRYLPTPTDIRSRHRVPNAWDRSDTLQLVRLVNKKAKP